MVAGTAVRKVKWSSEELAYIDLWMAKDDGDASSLAVSRCLTSIRAADNDTKAIFHPHHVLNSSRLRFFCWFFDKQLLTLFFCIFQEWV